jgi:DNA-binding NarL/FixJ family response regulator
MRLVICDDHLLLLTGLTSALAQLGFTIEAAVSTPDDAVRAVERHAPDVLLIDLCFPVGSGLDAAREVVRRHPGTRVVMLTGSDEPEHLAEALEIGAAGYIRKAQPIENIAAALEGAASGRLTVDRELLRDLRDDAAGVGQPRTPLDDLTPREHHVLQLLRRGMSTAEIVKQLEVSPSTVRTHVQSIFIKLDVHSRLQAVAVLDGAGAANGTAANGNGAHSTGASGTRTRDAAGR